MMEERGMKETVKKGKTVDDAVEAALAELGVGKDDVEITVLTEGNKGLFGLGSKEAEVKVTVIEKSSEEIARDFLNTVLEGIGLEASVDISTDEERMNIEISGESMGVIIGRRGETLSALQYLTSLVVNRKTEGYTKISIDTENYKKKREESLIKLANKTAEKVIKYRRNITLDPMNPYERRVIHSAISEIEGVSSRSVGEEPYRKIIISSNNPRKKRDNRRDGGRRNDRNRDNRRNDKGEITLERKSVNLSTSFEKDYKRPRPEDSIEGGLYGKIEL